MLDVLLEPSALIKTLGLLGVFLVVFLESGFFVGFFLPGDSLLFTAGLFAAQGYFSIVWLMVGVALAAIAGDSFGYAFGKKIGPRIFTKEDSVFFHKNHLMRAQRFYEKYGIKTIVLARFVPVVRTFAPILAGLGSMRYQTFLSFNIIGGLLWTILLTGAGFIFGAVIPDPERYILPVVLAIIIISVTPVFREYLRMRLARKKTFPNSN